MKSLDNLQNGLLIVISIPAVCVAWAAAYVFEAASDPFAGDETALFIQPLFYLLVATGLWVVIEAIVVDRSSRRTDENEDQTTFGASGLWEKRRLLLILSLPSMLLLIWLFGFIIAAVAYVSILAWGLGEQRIAMLATLALLSILIVWLFFKTLMGVPLPLWPAFVG